MKRLLIVGTIDETYSNVSGQYDRTEIIKNGLEKEGYPVVFVNMMNWKENLFSLFISISKNYFDADIVIFLASLNGTRVILNLLSLLKLFKKKSVFQIAVGGQSNFKFVQNSQWYRRKVGGLSAVFVEVESMIDDYKTVGLKNVFYLPNCKKVHIDEAVLQNAGFKEPYRFCTYSRVTPEKGIAEAIAVVEGLNKKYGRKYCTLDIYGTYLSEDKDWFDSLMRKTTDVISFKGRIERKDSIVTLSQYDLMLFPTQHTGEGVPGGMIDCYEAGLPIVTCNTSYMKNIVHDGKTGFVYDRNDPNGLEKAVMRYTEKVNKKQLKINCQDEVKKYDTDSVIEILGSFINHRNLA